VHNVEIRNLYVSPDILRVIKIKVYAMGGACSTDGGDKKFIQNF